MQQWELTAQFIPFTIDFNEKLPGVLSNAPIERWYWGDWVEPWEGWGEALELASEGWELVSAVPATSGFLRGQAGCSVTRGVYLFFKRPILDDSTDIQS